MRGTLLAGLMWIAATGVAFAQFGGLSDGAQTRDEQRQQQQSHNSNQNSHSHTRDGHDDTPAAAPLPRCADLGIAGYAFVGAVPGAPPLAADEIAVQWDIHNGGNAPFTASSAQAQTLTLEYSTPSGVHQIASMTVPAPPSGATAASAGAVTLAAGQSWRGYLRTTLPPESRRWQLHLKLTFAAVTSIYAAPVSDCDSDNNEITLSRPS
jgi:hypothetical protein